MSSPKIKVIVASRQNKAPQIRLVRAPRLRPDYLLVQVDSIALNPTDWKHAYRLCKGGERLGCDYAGTVVEVGLGVTKAWKPGDRVAGLSHGGNTVEVEDGAFAELAAAKGDIQLRVPDGWGLQEAAGLCMGLTTVGQALIQALGLPTPEQPATEPLSVLIYGGSSATGALAIQVARLAGLHVLTTCSPHNFTYVQELGAHVVLDYHDRNCARQLQDAANGTLAHVLDCISEGASTDICVNAMASTGGVYVNILAVDPAKVTKLNPNVQCKTVLGYTQFGERFQYGPTIVEPRPEDFAFMAAWYRICDDLVANRRIRPHRFDVNKFGKGLEGALKGMEYMRQGKLSGRKLVYSL